jgi:hypothetical protein
VLVSPLQLGGAVLTTVIVVYCALVSSLAGSIFNWLDFVMFLSYIKLGITFIK